MSYENKKEIAVGRKEWNGGVERATHDEEELYGTNPTDLLCGETHQLVLCVLGTTNRENRLAKCERRLTYC